MFYMIEALVAACIREIGIVAGHTRAEIEAPVPSFVEGALIADVGSRVIDSLIGKERVDSRQVMKPSAYRFMLGDNSEVGIRW